MKRIALITTIVFLGLGSTLWVSQSFVSNWEPRLRSQLEDRLGAALGCQVAIDHITLSFVHRIALENVEIIDAQSTPPVTVFRAKEVSLTLSLIDLPRAVFHRNPLETIGLISIDSPVLNLSADFMNRHKGGHYASNTPLWFTVEWKEGTFQWKDVQAPHGAWTLYQSRGIFRIRGPHMDATTDGALEQVESVHLHFASLGHRWNAQTRLERGDIPGVVALMQRILQRPLLPEKWKAEGRFHLDLKAGGLWPVVREKGINRLIQEARLTLIDTRLDTGQSTPPLQFNGGMILRSGRMDITSLMVQIEKSVFKISGHCWPFTQTPQLDLQAAGPQTDLALVSRFMGTTYPALAELRGLGAINIGFKGAATHPDLLLDAKIPQGSVGRWSFQNAIVLAQYIHHQWMISPSTLHVGQGSMTLKGTASKDRVDLQLTGNDLALQDIATLSSSSRFHGSLNFSVALQGPAENLNATGSYWVNNFTWGHNYTDSLRGDLDISSDHFNLEGASEDNAFHLTAEGSRTAKLVSLEEFQFQLPSGSVLTAHGTWAPPAHRMHLTLDAVNIAIPDDIPIFSDSLKSVAGTAELHGRLDGLTSNLVFRADVLSHHLQIGERTITNANATLHWTPGAFSVDPFHVEPGYSGSLYMQLGLPHQWDLKMALANAPADIVTPFWTSNKLSRGNLSGTLAIKDHQGLSGMGELNLSDGVLGNWAFSQGRLGFTLKERRLELQHFTLVTDKGKADFKGHAIWEASPTLQPPDRIFFNAQGRLASLNDGALWSIPCQIRGQLNPRNAWRGSMEFETPAIKVRNISEDPFSFHLNWDANNWSWDQVRWGKTLTGSGSLRQNGEQSQWSGQFKATDAQLAVWQTWIWPKLKEPVQGHLSGLFTLNGSLQQPQIQFSGKIHKGLWRAIAFDNDLSGTWTASGLEPLVLTGTLQKGGQFHFQGRVSNPDQNASGSLDLTQVNLETVGESLSFPHPLAGKANGTFTVNGPLDQLHLAGHVEGTQLTYGKPNSNPFKLQSVIMDMKLDPVEDQPNVVRLTVVQAVAKTLEEQIRLNPGSSVEFAGTNAARMRIGTEIRNLHLGVFTLFGGMDISGTWQIKPEGFDLEGDIYTRSLYINDYQLEQGHVNASYYNLILSFKPPREGAPLILGTIDFQNAPQLKFKDFAISGKDRQGLRLTGDIGPHLWNFAMEGQGLDIGTLSGLAGFPYPLQGTADAKIHGSGDLDHPQVEGTLKVQQGQVIGLNFQTGSAAFIWQGQHMTFTRLSLSDPGRYTLTGTGAFPLVAKENRGPLDKSINFSVRLEDSNLGLLQSFSREVKQAKGSVQALLQIKGTTDAPSLRGSIRVKNGYVDGAHYIRQLRNFQLAADFDGNDLVISELRGSSQKGEFTGGGHITFAGFEPRYYDLHMEVPSSKGIEVTVPELAIPESPLAKKLHFLTTASQCDVKGKAMFRGPAEAPVFIAQAYLSNGHFTFPPSSKNPPPPAFLEWVRRISWDTDLHFSDDAWFENELVEANLVGNLAIKGPSDRLKVDGGMDITDGKISYLGVEFTIRQAHYDIRTVDNGSTLVTTPYVRGLADSEVQTIDPTTGLSVTDTISLTINYAPVNEVKPQLASSLYPGLQQDKLLARVTQLDVDNLTPQERNYLYQQQMVRLIDTSLATPLAQSLLKRTGLVDELRVSRVINPAANSLPTNPNNPAATQQDTAANLLAGTKYTLNKNLSNRLSLGYGLRFDQIINPDLTNRLDLRSDVEMSYRFLSNVYLRGSFDLPTTTPGALPDRKVTIEPRWRFGWWGNTNKPKPKVDTSVPASTPSQGN